MGIKTYGMAFMSRWQSALNLEHAGALGVGNVALDRDETFNLINESF